MKKKRNILDFRKIEIINLSDLLKIEGGNGGTGATNDGDLTPLLSSRNCLNI